MKQIEAPWAKLPLSLLQDPEIKRSDLLVYALLDYRAGKRGWFWGAQIDFAQELGIGRQAVNAACHKLEEKGYITTAKGGIRKHNRLIYGIVARTQELPSTVAPTRQMTVAPTRQTKTQTPDIDDEERSPVTHNNTVKPSDVLQAIKDANPAVMFEIKNWKSYDQAFNGTLASPTRLPLFIALVDLIRRKKPGVENFAPLLVPSPGYLNAIAEAAEWCSDGPDRLRADDIRHGMEGLWDREDGSDLLKNIARSVGVFVENVKNGRQLIYEEVQQ